MIILPICFAQSTYSLVTLGEGHSGPVGYESNYAGIASASLIVAGVALLVVGLIQLLI